MALSTLAEPEPLELSFSKERFEIQHRFATPFVVAPLNDVTELNAALLTTILDRSRSDPGVIRSNRGGWQSAADFATWCGPAGTQLLETIVKLANGLTAIETAEGLVHHPPRWNVNAWANINSSGDANASHHHPAAFWSGVYWVGTGAAGDGGEFEMHDPRGILPAFYAPQLRFAIPGYLSAGSQDFYAPAAGVLVLFPAWLVHAVRPYQGAGQRVSIAFNLSVA